MKDLFVRPASAGITTHPTLPPQGGQTRCSEAFRQELARALSGGLVCSDDDEEDDDVDELEMFEDAEGEEEDEEEED